MLLCKPVWLFDVGFQLSYLAVFFILFLVPRFKEWIVVRNPLLAMPWEWITVSIAAQIGTALLCFYYFGQFSTVFLFTNLPVTLLAMFLIPFAFLWLGYPVDFYGYDWIQKIVEGLVHGMVRVVDVFSVMPYATITGRFSFFEMLGGYGFLVLCLIYMKIREPKVLLAALTLLLIISVKILIELFLIAGN
jgi:competence protein ComEC